MEQEGLDPVAYPKVEVLEVGKDGFTFKALVTVKPEYKIGEYKGLAASKEEVNITDEDVENELKPFIQRATRLVNVEREAKEGDTVLIDFEGFDNGVPFEGGKGENYALELGSHSFIPGFEEGVVGLKPGDEKDLDVTFPEPPAADSPLNALPNVFLTPHIAGSKGREVERMGAYMAEECARWLSGAPTPYEVTLPMLETMA